MFHLPDDTPLRPFCISSGIARPHLVWPEGLSVDFYDPLTPEDAPFCRAMNRANCIAYDGSDLPSATASALGMPLWVFLDCCTLPSAMVGFSAPRDALPEELASRLDPDGTLAQIGVSEYVALPSLEVGTVVGVSLFSLARGRRLGTRTKALGLFALRAQRQVGVAQYSNPSIRLHLAFSDLELMAPHASVHSRPAETFVYRASVPDPGRLAAMVSGVGFERRERRPRDVVRTIDPRDESAVRSLGAGGERLTIVGAGPAEAGLLTELRLAAGDVLPTVDRQPHAAPAPRPQKLPKPAPNLELPLLVVGCGYAGTAIALAAVKGGRVVWGTTRDPARAADLAAAGIRPVLVDFAHDMRFPELPEAPGWEVVVTVGPEPSARPHQLLERILDWLPSAAVRRLVYLSATSVYPGGSGEQVEDETPASPVTVRGQVRLDAEHIVEAWGNRNAIPTVRLRLPGIYGPGRTPLPRFADGSYRIYCTDLVSNRIFVDDIAEATMLLLARRDLNGAVLACDDAPTPIVEVARYIAERHDLPLPPTAPIAECAPATRDFWEGSRVCVAQRLRAEGWRPRYPTFVEGFDEAWRRERNPDGSADPMFVSGLHTERAIEHVLDLRLPFPKRR